MSQEASAPAAQKTRQRLSSAQMLHLMRLETDQALRHRYPLSCMVIGLDGFEGSPGVEQRRALMPQVFRALKEVCFEGDVRGLGLFTERYHLAVFPHVAPDKLKDLAQAMLEKARVLEVPALKEKPASDEDEGEPTVINLDEPAAEVEKEAEHNDAEEDQPRNAVVTLSIGISHNLHPGEISFESIVEDAETGMGLASGAGGDRFIQAREVETELDRLREEIQRQISELSVTTEDLIENKDSEEEAWARNLTGKTLSLFELEVDQSEGVLRLKGEVIALLQTELKTWRETSTVSQMLEKQRQIQNLERRVTKLTSSLDMTEAELKRVASMKNIDTGVSSIYRNVQGLNAEDDQSEAKGAMLAELFQANMALRGK
ncbi:MAG: GGDEF domain-containing protein [Planctomycetota bacterium]|jgi:GGDEF domain-containing protein